MRNSIKEWLAGHVTITVRGKRFERFINRAVRGGLHIWNIRIIGEELGQCEITVRDYFRVRPFLRETGCRPHVVHRSGLPFLIVRMRKRAGFALGALLFLLGMYVLSTFVWNVEVKGTHRISPYAVSKAAEQIGLKTGSWKPVLAEPQTLQRQLLALLPEASWVGVEIRGTKLIIQVVEKDVPEKQQVIGPRHLIAKKKAVVHSIIAETGKTMVKVNQFVNKGQVLISGLIGNDERQALVPARGKVKGEVWYVSDVSVPYKMSRSRLTGEQETRYYLTVGSYALRLWPFETKTFPSAETLEHRSTLQLGQVQVPLGWKTVTQQEVETVARTLTPDEADALAKQFARKDVLAHAEKDAVIADEKVLHRKEENGKVYLSIHYTVIEEIAEEQPLVAAPPPAPDENP